MDLQPYLNILFGITLSGIISFGVYIVRQLNEKLNRTDVKELIQDKNYIYLVYVQELKEDIKRVEDKLDKLLDKYIDK